MADKKISELTTASTIGNTTIFVVVVDPDAANPNTQSITANNLFGSVPVNMILGANCTVNGIHRANSIVLYTSNTPANSSANGEKGTIFYDNSYIYIATANNTWKRVALTSF